MNESDLRMAKAIVESEKDENTGVLSPTVPRKTVIGKVHEKLNTFR